MPTAVRDGVRIHWEAMGDPNNPPLLLLNSIGTDLHLWDRVMPYLGAYYVMRMDTRGHGQSDAPLGDYSLEMLANDAIAVLDFAGLARAAIAGVSLGGMIAMQIAILHAQRINALIPICTSANMDKNAWSARVETVRSSGTVAIVELAMSRFLSAAFREAEPEIAAEISNGLLVMADDGYAGCAAAIRDMDIAKHLGDITTPTIVIAGDLDTSTPFEGHGSHIVEAIRGARVAHLAAAHLAPLELPQVLAATIIHFLENATKVAPIADSDTRWVPTTTTGEVL